MSKIDAMTTVAAMNHLSPEELGQYANWMRDSHYPPDETAPACGKRVLGRQDYCWAGAYRRNWIWERPFEVDLGDGQIETWHWRLFASARGFTLEIEDKHNLPFGKEVRHATSVGFADFLAVWASKAS